MEHEAIVGPVDLRTWLGLPRRTQGETLLVLGTSTVVRLVVDQVEQLAHSDLRRVHPMPSILWPLTRRLHLRGVVEHDGMLAYLVDPRPLTDDALCGGAA